MGKKKASSGAASACDELSFEESLDRVEQIVHQLEDGQLGLNDALVQYEQGVKFLQHCFQTLERAERKIELLAGLDGDGRARTQPFDDEQTLSLDEKQAARSRRRSRSAAPSGEQSDGQPTGDADVDIPGGLF